MASISLSSSTGSMGGDDEGSSSDNETSRSSGSLSQVERSDAGRGSLESSKPNTDRIVHWATLFLLEGGVEVGAMRVAPAGGWPAISGYEWASHDVGSYESEFGSRDALLR